MLLWFGLRAHAADFEGVGATMGGDRSPVVTVTSLEDSGPGTLREALQAGQRRVVFKQGGVITLKKALIIKGPNVTVDGEGAAGLVLRGAPVVIEGAQDVILRHLRVRDSADDNIRIIGKCRRVVIDHCSSTHAGDGALDITHDYKNPADRPAEITISWCLIGDTKKAMLIDGADKVSLHHNLFLGNEQRSPQLHDVRGFDLRNNVIDRWGIYGTRVRAGSTGNIVNNWFGLSTNKKLPELALILEGQTGDNPNAAAGLVHASGNLSITKINLDRLSTAPNPAAAPRVAVSPVAQLRAILNKSAGARPLDKVDQAILTAH